MVDILCPKCGMVPILGCDQISGHIPTEDGLTKKMCRNLYSKSMRVHLGKELSNTKHVNVSPLFERDSDGNFVVDRTDENLFISGCTWYELLPHLKLVLGLKGLDFHFRIVTDQQIKNVFVGNERKQFRVEGEVFYNSLGDLVADFNLVIIKLGYIGYKNRAAAGALKEALLIREALNSPTWIFEDTTLGWTHSCDPDVEYHVEQWYEPLPIGGGSSKQQILPSVMETDDMGVDPDPEEFMPDAEGPTDEPIFESLDPSGDDKRGSKDKRRGREGRLDDGGRGDDINLPGV